ncbi:MAG: FAD-binding oxidoreductase, partial [Trichococcus flocculiformis]
MSQAMMTVVSQKEIAKDIFELRLKGAIVNEMGAPDQFLHIRVPGDELLLRRPISIASIDAEKEECVIIYRTEGKGTTIISQLTAGDELDILGPLGNGYPIDMLEEGQNALLIGGGIGVP